MSDYDKRLSGALFKNDKGGNPNRPDYRGSYTDGDNNEFWMSAWVKKSAKGETFMSISMQPKDAQKPQTAKKQYADDSDDLPF